MTDEQLDPEREADVRRLLAEARYDEPMPADVAARLDRVLSELAAEETSPVSAGPRGAVLDLAAQRRRRVRNLLVAAAAVTVLGVGLSRLDLTSTSEMDAGGASSSDAGGDSASALQEEAPAAGAESDLAQRAAPAPTSPRPLVVTDDDFASEEHLRSLRSTVLDYSTAEDSITAASEGATAWFTCGPGPFGPGRLLAVEYAGSPAVLAVRPTTGDSTVVELLRCGTGDVLRSATVAVP